MPTFWGQKAHDAQQKASPSHQAVPSQCFRESEKNITELIKGAERNVIQEISSVPKETQEMVLQAMDRQITPVIIEAFNKCMAQLQKTSKVHFHDVSTQAAEDSPDENSSHHDLTHLDLASSTSTQDSSFTAWVTNPCTKQLVHKMRKTSQALTGVEAKHEIAKHQMEAQRQALQHLQREGTLLIKEKEEAVKVLSEHKKEIVDLTEANKGMTESIKELTAEKTELTDRLAGLETEHEKAQRQIELQEEMVRSLQRKVTLLAQELTTQEGLQDKNKEIEDLTEANKAMQDTIEELLAVKTKLTNKLAMLEGQEEQRFQRRHALGEASARETTKDTMDEEDKVTSLQREVTQLKQKLEEVQKLLLDNKRENDDLTKANKGMKDTINKMTRSKDDNLESLQMKVPQLTQEIEAAQKELSDKSQELEDLTGANNGLKDELTNKLARMEEEGKLKDRKVESLQEEVTRLKQKAAAQKILSDMAGSSPSMNDEARGGAAGTTSDGSHHRGQRRHRFKLPSCLSPKTKP